MELLNVGFVFLIVKIAICTLPGVLGLIMVVSSEDKKREMRNKMCNSIFGVSNAIPLPKFTVTMVVVGALLIIFSLTASWFLLLRGLF